MLISLDAYCISYISLIIFFFLAKYHGCQWSFKSCSSTHRPPTSISSHRDPGTQPTAENQREEGARGGQEHWLQEAPDAKRFPKKGGEVPKGSEQKWSIESGSLESPPSFGNWNELGIEHFKIYPDVPTEDKRGEALIGGEGTAEEEVSEPPFDSCWQSLGERLRLLSLYRSLSIRVLLGWEISSSRYPVADLRLPPTPHDDGHSSCLTLHSPASSSS